MSLEILEKLILSFSKPYSTPLVYFYFLMWCVDDCWRSHHLPILFPRCHLNGTFLFDMLASSLTMSRRLLLMRPITCFLYKNSFLLVSIFLKEWRTFSSHGVPGSATKLSLCFPLSLSTSSPLSPSPLLAAKGKCVQNQYQENMECGIWNVMWNV